MQTAVYWIPKKKTDFGKWTRGFQMETAKQPVDPIWTFWNPLFPTQYLRNNPDINSRWIMIEVPLPRWKQICQNIAFRLFNFQIGRLHVITDNSDPTIFKRRL